ncbi:polyprenyl synthetase [Porphyromonas macacae]|uniref:polyprenyl synthetase family protein n=1 Tax=Porphyromonas macacae TaxID=28115 RepID=UPI00052C5D5A|nr:polyprenyl synthetase family protein [Porphyromonas macacae]KGN98533.1 polyprenyl synthetase [Porphyromonas macacae]
MQIETIQAPVAPFLESFREQYNAVLQSKSEWLTIAIDHLYSSNGKQLRPLFMGLMASLFTDELPKETVEVAVVLELIHTATLIHDDVIDDSDERRGNATLNTLYYNNVAVLMGDYILTSAIKKAIEVGDLMILSKISELGKQLTEGEIIQYETAEKVILDEKVYFEVIHEKTAALFITCAEIAVHTVNASREETEKCKRVAELFGYAFQIRDDIFDYYDHNVGKPTGNDIREGKITLPLLHALEVADGDVSREIRQLLHQKKFSAGAIHKLISFAKENGGIEYAREKMETFLNEAKNILKEFPDSKYRSSLLQMADYISYRKI